MCFSHIHKLYLLIVRLMLTVHTFSTSQTRLHVTRRNCCIMRQLLTDHETRQAHQWAPSKDGRRCLGQTCEGSGASMARHGSTIGALHTATYSGWHSTASSQWCKASQPGLEESETAQSCFTRTQASESLVERCHHFPQSKFRRYQSASSKSKIGR